ncbi:hypothetical protein [Mucilaginibacter sp. SG564]
MHQLVPDNVAGSLISFHHRHHYPVF